MHPMSKPVRADLTPSEIAALTKELSTELADVRKTVLTPQLVRVLGKIERLLGARRQQVIEARAALDRLAQENVRLQRAANHDALTGLHNRRSFDAALVRECNRASRGQSRVALLMFDVDHFRALNNARGHVYGDECLRMIGAVIADEASRSTDLAARIGGEEFAIVLPGATTQAACARAQEICDAVRARRLQHGASVANDYVTLSVGVASLVPRPHMDPRVLAYLADQALYDAKRGGRNQVAIASDADGDRQLLLARRLRDEQIHVGWYPGTKPTEVTAITR